MLRRSCELRSTRSCCRRAVPTGWHRRLARTSIPSCPKTSGHGLGMLSGPVSCDNTVELERARGASRDAVSITPSRRASSSRRDPLRAARSGWQCLRLPGRIGHMSMDGDGAVTAATSAKSNWRASPSASARWSPSTHLDLTRPARRVPLAARALRVRQDHHAAHVRRFRAARRRHDHDQRAVRCRASRPTSATSTPCSRATPCSRTWTSPRTWPTGCGSAASPSRRSPTVSAMRSTWSR